MEDYYEIVANSNVTYYYKNDCPHREDGPAIEFKSGTQYWYIDGYLHREDGPACIENDGNKEWWINNDNITGEVEEWMSSNNIPQYEDWTNKEIALFKLKFL